MKDIQTVARALSFLCMSVYSAPEFLVSTRGSLSVRMIGVVVIKDTSSVGNSAEGPFCTSRTSFCLAVRNNFIVKWIMRSVVNCRLGTQVKSAEPARSGSEPYSKTVTVSEKLSLVARVLQ